MYFFLYFLLIILDVDIYKYYQSIINSDLNEKCNNLVTNGLKLKRPKS